MPLFYVLLIFLCGLSVGAAEAKNMTPPSLGQFQALNDGITLYKIGKINEAGKRFEKLIEEKPDYANAYYELALVRIAEKNYDSALKLANQAAEFDAFDRESVLSLQASILDVQGKSAEAILAYNNAIIEFPDSHQLHYNRGVTFTLLNEVNNARADFEFNARRNPAHASSHLALGMLTAQMGYRSDAMLSLLHFLVLEPNGERAKMATNVITQLQAQGINIKEERGEDGKIQAEVSEKAFTKNGQADLLLSLTAIAAKQDEENDSVLSGLQLWLALVVESDKATKDLSAHTNEIEISFINAVQEKGFMPLYLHYALQDALATSAKWLDEHHQQRVDFENWLALVSRRDNRIVSDAVQIK